MDRTMEDPLIRFCVRHGSPSMLHQILDASLNTRNLTLIVAEILRVETKARLRPAIPRATRRLIICNGENAKTPKANKTRRRASSVRYVRDIYNDARSTFIFSRQKRSPRCVTPAYQWTPEFETSFDRARDFPFRIDLITF